MTLALWLARKGLIWTRLPGLEDECPLFSISCQNSLRDERDELWAIYR